MRRYLTLLVWIVLGAVALVIFVNRRRATTHLTGGLQGEVFVAQELSGDPELVPASGVAGGIRKEVPSPAACSIVQAKSEAGGPVPGADVVLGFFANGQLFELKGTTDAQGAVLFGQTSGQPVLLRVSCMGYATLHFVRPIPTTESIDCAQYVVTLLNESVLEVVSLNRDGIPLAGRLVVAALVAGSDPGRRPQAGAEPYRVGVTDGEGVLVFRGLAEGEWSVRCGEWKDGIETEEQGVAVTSDQSVRVSIKIEQIALDTFASGQLVLPSLPISEFHTIDEFGIRNTAGELLSFWLYEDGAFYVVGNLGDRVTAVLVDRFSNRESRAFEFLIGQHDHFITIEW